MSRKSGRRKRVWCLYCRCAGTPEEHASSPCRPVKILPGGPVPDDGIDRDIPDASDSPLTMRDLG